MIKTIFVNKKKFIAGFLFALCLFGGLLFWGEWGRQRALSHTESHVSSPVVTAGSFSYKGVEGENALELLKSHRVVEQAPSGLVVSINGRKALDTKHEYWAFYVNGKIAQVGPADYVTKSTDILSWKIETY